MGGGGAAQDVRLRYLECSVLKSGEQWNWLNIEANGELKRNIVVHGVCDGGPLVAVSTRGPVSEHDERDHPQT